jgi:hypothetical protein
MRTLQVGIPAAIPKEEKAASGLRRLHLRADAVQLAVADGAYSEGLQQAMSQDWAFHGWNVQCVEMPDLTRRGVIVVDRETFDRLPPRLPHPERIVLITHRDPEQLSRAWDAGIVSVIDQSDPVSTAMLAILAARFRSARLPP